MAVETFTVDLVQAYLGDTRQFPLISKREEQELARRIEAGRAVAKARDRLGSPGIDGQTVTLSVVGSFYRRILRVYPVFEQQAGDQKLIVRPFLKKVNDSAVRAFLDTGQPGPAVKALSLATRVLPPEVLVYCDTPFLPWDELKNRLGPRVPILDRWLDDIQTRGKRARNQLVVSNLRLVVRPAKRFLGRGLELEDLIQVGNLGLIKAVEKFDYRLGYRFSTYASWWVRQTISRDLENSGRTIKIPSYMHKFFRKLDKAEDRLLEALGREPTEEEIAQELGISAEELREVYECRRRPASLEAEVDGGLDDYTVLSDLISGRSDTAEEAIWRVDQTNRRKAVKKLLHCLNKQQRRVIKLRFGLVNGSRSMTLAEVGSRLGGLTRERIRQIEVEALGRLRKPANAAQLRDLLGLDGDKPEVSFGDEDK